MLSLKPKANSFRNKSLVAAPTLVISNSDIGYQYLLATPTGKTWRVESYGDIQLPSPVEDVTSEENESAQELNSEATQIEDSDSISTWSKLLESPWEIPNLKSTKGRRLILCLQRPEIEFYTLQILQDPEEDLTETIQNELTIREKISLEDVAIDYCTPLLPDAPHFAASVPSNALQEWTQAAKDQGWKLDQAFVRSLGTARLFQNLSIDQLKGSCLVLAVYGQQADLILLHQKQPCFIRNLVVPDDLNNKEITASLLSEIRLSISSLDLPFLDETLCNAVVAADDPLANELIIQLKMELEIDSVKLGAADLPEFQWATAQEDLPTSLLPMLGSLQMETQKPGDQLLDFRNPKQPVQPPSIIKRVALLVVLLAIVLGYFGMNFYDQYQANHKDLLKIVQVAKKDKAAYTDKLPDAKLVQYVQAWQKTEVQWLNQLQALTEKLPTGDLAVIRQFSGEQTADGAKLTLQIHVRDLEVTRAIEKSISESNLRLDFRQVVKTNNAEFPFRLDTIVFAPWATETTETESSETSDPAKEASPVATSNQAKASDQANRGTSP